MKGVRSVPVSQLAQTSLTIATRGRGFTELTADAGEFVSASGLSTGMFTAFVRHTSCSLLITENADADVRRDLEAWMARQVKDGDPIFRHRAEGPDDMSAHIRSVLTATSVSIPVVNGRLAVGTWQGLYLWEHRRNAHQREVLFTVTGS